MLDPSRTGPVAEARLNPPAHRHVSVDCLHAADQLSLRGQAGAGESHRVSHSNPAPVGVVGGLENVRVRQVSPLGTEGDLGRELKPPAPLMVE